MLWEFSNNFYNDTANILNKVSFCYPYHSFLIIYIPLTTSKMANDSSNSSNEEQNCNSLDQNGNTIIGIRDDLNKLKTEVIALKMFITDQLYLLKQSVGSTKAPKYNPSSDFYIKSLIRQIEYLKEEKKTKNSIIQSLLYQTPSSAANSQMKDNNNNSSSFSYSENVVNPNGSNLKNDGLITNDCINNNSNDVSDENTNHSDNDDDNNKEKVSDTNSSLK